MYKIGLTLMVRARPEPITPRPSVHPGRREIADALCQSGENGDFISLDFPRNVSRFTKKNAARERRFFLFSRLRASFSLSRHVRRF